MASPKHKQLKIRLDKVSHATPVLLSVILSLAQSAADPKALCLRASCFLVVVINTYLQVA